MEKRLTVERLKRGYFRLYLWFSKHAVDRKKLGSFFNGDSMAESIFDFSVNAGVVASVKVAQAAARASVDGVIGPVTLSKINGMDPPIFLAFFSLVKIPRQTHR